MSWGTGKRFAEAPVSNAAQSSVSAMSISNPEDACRNYFLEADALMRSLTCPELYGDERNQIIAKLNQVAAALGVGNGFYKDGESVHYNPEGPFYRFKSVGYNTISDFAEADGVVSLIMNVPIVELATSAQKQKVIDVIFTIIGGIANLPVKIQGIKALVDNQTEVNIFVVNKSSGTPTPSSTLAKFLSDPAIKAQLEQQLKVEKIIAKFTMDKYQKERFVRDPPPGYDDALWQQACRENPDPTKLLPFPIRGFDQLLIRQKTQHPETEMLHKVIENLLLRLRELSTAGELAGVKATQQRVAQKQLSHRLLRILCMQQIQQRFGLPVEPTEENIKAALENLSARLSGPYQIKERLFELTTAINDENSELRSKNDPSSLIILSKSDVQQLQKYLVRCQDGLESLSNIVRDNLAQLGRISASMDESHIGK